MRKPSVLSERSQPDKAARRPVPATRGSGREQVGGEGRTSRRAPRVCRAVKLPYDAASAETGHSACVKVETRTGNDTGAKP